MCSSISRVHADLWKEPGTDDPYRAIFHVLHSEVASSVSRNCQNPVRLRRFNKDDVSKLFFNGVVGSWDDFKVTTFDQQRETLAGLCSYETFSLEGPVLTFRLIAKACKFEQFLLFGGILGFGVLDATVDPNAATLLDLVERDGALYWEIVKDHFIEDCHRKHYPRTFNEALSLAKFSRRGIIDLCLQIDPSDCTLRYIVGGKKFGVATTLPKTKVFRVFVLRNAFVGSLKIPKVEDEPRTLLDLTAWELTTLSSEAAEEHDLDENEFTNGLLEKWYLDEIPNAPSFPGSQTPGRRIKSKRTSLLDCENLSVKKIFIKREEAGDPHKIRIALCIERTTTSKKVLID